jgi:hypothetical protein
MLSTTEQEMQSALGLSSESGENQSIENKELISRIRYDKNLDIINHDGKYFLALGVNRVSEIFDDLDSLHNWIASETLDVAFRIAVTVISVLNNNENKN